MTKLYECDRCGIYTDKVFNILYTPNKAWIYPIFFDKKRHLCINCNDLLNEFMNFHKKKEK